MPHFGHMLALALVVEVPAVLMIMRAMSSRSGSVWCVVCWCVASVVVDAAVDVVVVVHIDPGESLNMHCFLALVRTQTVEHNS